MNDQFVTVMDRFDTITLEMAKINHNGLQPRTWDRLRKDLEQVKADLKKALLTKPAEKADKKIQPIKAASDKGDK